MNVSLLIQIESAFGLTIYDGVPMQYAAVSDRYPQAGAACIGKPPPYIENAAYLGNTANTYPKKLN